MMQEIANERIETKQAGARRLHHRVRFFTQMTREEFQHEHGAAWAQMTSHPAFFAAMQLCNADKLQKISNLRDEDIKEHGHEILAGLRDHLALENELIELAVTTQGAGFDLPEETYEDESRSLAHVSNGEETESNIGALSPFEAFQAQKTKSTLCQKPPQPHKKRKPRSSSKKPKL